MSDTITPGPANRKLLIFLWLVVVLLSGGWLYARAVQIDLPRWADLRVPPTMGIFGLIVWLSPHETLSMSPVFRRWVVTFFIAAAVVALILYFV